MKKAIMVSVICLAYNHERYIRKALEGFVMQKTDFPFEVIVHDDASTDGTRSIIEEYVEKYPNLFVPIYQDVNQYSKGVKIANTIALPRVRGKYTTFCEGDDFWCDENKLQIQFDYMETHPDCSMCVHNSGEVNDAGEDLGTRYGRIEEECDLTFATVLGRFREKVCQTASFFLRTKYYQEMPKDLFSGGEYAIASYMAMCGKVHYMPQAMAYYRILRKGSWTEKRVHDWTLQIQDLLVIRARLTQWNEYTQGDYSEVFEALQAWNDYGMTTIMYKYIFPRLSAKKRLKAAVLGIIAALGLWDIALQCKRKICGVFGAKH